MPEGGGRALCEPLDELGECRFALAGNGYVDALVRQGLGAKQRGMPPASNGRELGRRCFTARKSVSASAMGRPVNIVTPKHKASSISRKTST